MALRYSLNEGAAADAIDKAVQEVLASGTRTADIMADGCTQVGTDIMGDALIAQFDKSFAQKAA